MSWSTKRLALAALSFLASSLYWPGVSGAATTPRWAVLFAFAPWLIVCQRLTPAHVAGALFLAWAALSLCWDAAPLDGVAALATLMLAGALFCVGYGLEDLRAVHLGAGLGNAVCALGLYVNRDMLGEAAALSLVAAVFYRWWWLVAALVPALVLSGSRTAIVALAAALAVHYRRRWWLVGLAAMALIAATAWWKFTGSGSGIGERLALWQGAIAGTTWIGHGIGSFWQEFARYDPRELFDAMPEHAHNEFLHIAFELGVVGGGLFTAFCLCLVGPLDPERLVLIAFAVEACFGFPLYVPATAFLGSLAAGHAVRNRARLRNGADCRRRVKSAWLEAQFTT